MSKTLLLSLKNNEHWAMDELFKVYWEEVFDTAFKRLGDEDIAQDITQEIFISLWENRHAISIDGSLSGYLHGAVKYKVINHFKSRSMREGHYEELIVLMAQQQSERADAGLIIGEVNSEVEAAMALLPERMRTVISMSRKQDKTIKEIASELGISVQTVKNQITAAMKILKENLSYILFLALFLS